VLIDDLDERVNACERALRQLGADRPYVPPLMTAPGIAWVLGYTIAAEIGDIARFASAKKLCGYTGLCPRVYQSGGRDHRGPLAKHGPTWLRWALIEAGRTTLLIVRKVHRLLVQPRVSCWHISCSLCWRLERATSHLEPSHALCSIQNVDSQCPSNSPSALWPKLAHWPRSCCWWMGTAPGYPARPGR
jgi:hypothetical protein